MENPEITVELTLSEINMILATLGKHPFDDVVALIAKIRSQGEIQIKALQDANSSDTETVTDEV